MTEVMRKSERRFGRDAGVRETADQREMWLELLLVWDLRERGRESRAMESWMW